MRSMQELAAHVEEVSEATDADPQYVKGYILGLGFGAGVSSSFIKLKRFDEICNSLLVHEIRHVVSFPNKNIHHKFREGYIEGLSWALSTKDEEL